MEEFDPKPLRSHFFRRKMYFDGVPAPVGAAYALLPMMVSLDTFMEKDSLFRIDYTREMVVAQLLLTAFLMTCSLPTFSSKMLKKNKGDSHLRNRSTGTATLKLTAVAIGMACLVFYLVKLFFFATLCHACSLPIGWFCWRNFAS